MILVRALVPFTLIAGLLASVTRADTTTDTTAAASLIVFGRTAETHSAAAPAESLTQAVAREKQQLAADAQSAASVAQKAFVDAFGHAPAAGEFQSSGVATYSEWMQRNVKTLSEQPEKFEAAIRAAYPLVIHRDAYPEEITYWKKHGVVPYSLLLAAIENWARRNQPGLMVTAGVPTISINSSYLTTVRIAPATQAEARAVVGLTAATKEASGSIIAPGGEGIETDGGMYFVAAGR